jgi:hypothetical protein
MNGVTALLGDGDTGWHIRTGEWILAHGRVPRQDIFSFTMPGAPWYAWEWLSDVLMGWLHQTGGMQAVLLGAIVLLCATSGLLYRLIFQKSGSALIAFALTAVATGASSIHWLARPHLFTMLLLVISYSILEKKDTRILVALPPITAVWVNLHGGFVMGLLLVGAYAGGEAVRVLVTHSPAERREAAKRCGYYALTVLACAAASLVNPYGWHLHQHLIAFLRDPAYFENIAEFASISFRHPLAPFFELTLVLALAAGMWSVLQKRYTSCLLLVGWAHFALLSTRNIPLFMIVAGPLIGRTLAEWLELARREGTGSLASHAFRRIAAISIRLNAVDRRGHWHLAVPAALIMMGAMLYAHPHSAAFRSEYDARRYPTRALAVLRKADRIFTSDTWGGYLIYCRYPEKVFLDGRSDFYGPAFEAKYAAIAGARYNWEANLAAYKVDTLLLPVDSPLSSTLKGSGHWQAVYDDGMAIVFRRRP